MDITTKPKSYRKLLVYDNDGEVKELLLKVAKIVALKSTEIGINENAEDVSYSKSIKFLYEQYLRNQQKSE